MGLVHLSIFLTEPSTYPYNLNFYLANLVSKNDSSWLRCGDAAESYYTIGVEIFIKKVLKAQHFLPSVAKVAFPQTKEDMFKGVVAEQMSSKYKTFYDAHKVEFHAFLIVVFD